MGQMTDASKNLGTVNNLYAKMPYGGRGALPLRDKDPLAQEAARKMFQEANMQPGMGLGTTTYAPDAGFQLERRRREARGASAGERMRALEGAGVTDRDGMRKVFDRLYASPERAFMLARGR
jgi:hypothetical protein